MAQKKKQVQKQSQMHWWLLGLIGVTTLITMAQVSKFDFLSNWDDQSYILNNPHIQAFSFDNIKAVFSNFYVSNYQPLTMLVYMIEFSFFKMTPGSFHVVNLLVHLLNIFLVFQLFNRLTKNQKTALFVAALFALHPTRLESVAWISELKDLMYTCFYLLSLDFYVRYIRDQKIKKYLYLSMGMFLLSCLSKSMAITLPAILFLIDYWERRDKKWNLVMEKVPFAILTVVFGVLALYTQSGQAMEVALDAGPVNRFFLVFYGVFMYIFKLVWPFGLAGIHYYPKITDGSLPMLVYVSPLIIAALFWGLWQLKSIRREVIFGLTFFILSISIVLQLLPFGYAIIAERYTYVPYLGLFFIMAHVFQLIRDGKYLPSLKSSIDYVALGLVAFFAIVTYQRAPIWENALTFYGDIIEKYPDADHAHWMLGNVQKDYGMTQDAIATYNKAIELNPEYAMAFFNRGVMYAKLNKHQDAIKDYNKTLLLEDDYVAAYNNKGNSLKALGSSLEAIEMYNKALELDSNFSPSYAARGDVYMQMGQLETARADYEKASKLTPYDFQLVYMQGVCLYNLNKLDQACELWKIAAAKNVKEAIDAMGKFCPK